MVSTKVPCGGVWREENRFGVWGTTRSILCSLLLRTASVDKWVKYLKRPKSVFVQAFEHFEDLEAIPDSHEQGDAFAVRRKIKGS